MYVVIVFGQKSGNGLRGIIENWAFRFELKGYIMEPPNGSSVTMPWYKVTISAHQASCDEHGKLQDKFLKIFMMLRGPKDMALLSGGWSRSDTFNIYFTPDCVSNPAMKALIDSCGAVPCDEPTRETERELGSPLGHSGRWDKYIWHPDLE